MFFKNLEARIWVGDGPGVEQLGTKENQTDSGNWGCGGEVAPGLERGWGESESSEVRFLSEERVEQHD